MSTNRILIAGLIGGVVNFFLGYLLYGALLVGFFEANQGTATGLMKEMNEMIWWALILGNLVTGLLFAVIFGRWANISTLAGGGTAGLVLGLLIGAANDLISYATMNTATFAATIVDIIVYGVMGAVTGAVVGFVLGYKKSS